MLSNKTKVLSATATLQWKLLKHCNKQNFCFCFWHFQQFSHTFYLPWPIKFQAIGFFVGGGIAKFRDLLYFLHLYWLNKNNLQQWQWHDSLHYIEPKYIVEICVNIWIKTISSRQHAFETVQCYYLKRLRSFMCQRSK